VPGERRGQGAEANGGFPDGQMAEQGKAQKADALLDETASTSTQSRAGVIAKLAVVVREASDNRPLRVSAAAHSLRLGRSALRLTHKQ